jgi:DNA-binding transcriptional LysR family regulator
MSIDLKQLKYFLAVAEEKSFSRAAERLHISQPPLSQQIMKLESELGVRLFTRTTRSFELTVAGKALMGDAADLLARMRMTIDTIRQIDRGEVGRLRVGIVGSAMWGPIPGLLEQFQSRFPRVTWTLHELGPNDQLDALRARQIDVGFWREPKLEDDQLRNANLRQELCFREDVCVAINHQHPLAKRPHLDLAEIAAEPMLTLAIDKSPEPRYLIQCCEAAGFTPTIQRAVGKFVHHLHRAGRRAGGARVPEHLAVGWAPGAHANVRGQQRVGTGAHPTAYGGPLGAVGTKASQ